MVDLRSDLPPLTDEQRVQVESAFTLIVLKILMGEIAAVNRTPREANEYLAKLKSRMQSAMSETKDDESTFFKQFNREMFLLTEELFQGISFERVKK